MADLLEELKRPAPNEDQWHRVVGRALPRWTVAQRCELADHLDALGNVRLRLLAGIARDTLMFPPCAWPRVFS